jgi:magnesium transporter
MTVDAIVYSSDGIAEYDDIGAAKEAAGTTWVRANAVTGDALRELAAAFDIHPLAIEDVENGVRPKTEEYTGHTFTLLKTAELTRGEATFAEEIETDPVGIFIGSDWVVSMAPGTDEPVDRVWRAVVNRDERLLERGPDFTAYRIMDVIVDEYFTVLDRIEDGIEHIEEDVVDSTDIETLEAINGVRRDLLSFRKVAWPAREALSVLARGDPAQVSEATEKYFRDVYDHLIQVVDLTETYRDLASGARDIYLNTVAQSTNEVMKVLTVIATVFLPLTFVVGVYGMNFETMPELGWTFGYPAVMLGMALIAVAMLWYFREQEYI